VKRSAKIAEEISVLMPKIARRILMGFFGSVEITQTQLFTIITLYEKGPCRFSELSGELKISAPTATGIIDRLEKSGHVKRIPDKEDRRAINIHLTAKGIRIAKTLRATLKDQWQTLLEKLSASDRENYLEILRKIFGTL
jgi:DNA-binding MarR family transcriptional regulator